MKQFQAIALERIYRLFELAAFESEKHPERSKRYVELSLLLCTRNRVKMPKELRLNFCKKCHSYLNSKNSSVERKEALITLYCKVCGFSRKMRAPGP